MHEPGNKANRMIDSSCACVCVCVGGGGGGGGGGGLPHRS